MIMHLLFSPATSKFFAYFKGSTLLDSFASSYEFDLLFNEFSLIEFGFYLGFDESLSNLREEVIKNLFTELLLYRLE